MSSGRKRRRSSDRFGCVDFVGGEINHRLGVSVDVERVKEAVQAHRRRTDETKLDDLRGREVLGKPRQWRRACREFEARRVSRRPLM